MNSLANISRQRAVLTAIADAIVATAAGRSLRVAVGSTGPSDSGFADHLTQALIARGRPCRCVPATAAPVPPAGAPPQGAIGELRIAVIVGGAPGRPMRSCAASTSSSRATCRTRRPAPDLGSPPRCCTAGLDAALPDIVVDYYATDGPTIRHLAATLTLVPGQRVPGIGPDRIRVGAGRRTSVDTGTSGPRRRRHQMLGCRASAAAKPLAKLASTSAASRALGVAFRHVAGALEPDIRSLHRPVRRSGRPRM